MTGAPSNKRVVGLHEDDNNYYVWLSEHARESVGESEFSSDQFDTEQLPVEACSARCASMRHQ